MFNPSVGPLIIDHVDAFPLFWAGTFVSFGMPGSSVRPLTDDNAGAGASPPLCAVNSSNPGGGRNPDDACGDQVGRGRFEAVGAAAVEEER
jgi:hypothetical protein